MLERKEHNVYIDNDIKEFEPYIIEQQLVIKLTQYKTGKIRWKSYIDKVDAYQGEIVSKSEVLKQFKLKVKRSQNQLILEEWEECDLLLREIFTAFQK